MTRSTSLRPAFLLLVAALVAAAGCNNLRDADAIRLAGGAADAGDSDSSAANSSAVNNSSVNNNSTVNNSSLPGEDAGADAAPPEDAAPGEDAAPEEDAALEEDAPPEEHDAPGEPNACGGAAPLSAAPGDLCGMCGVQVCKGDGEEAGLTCVDPGRDACGGCGLPENFGGACVAGEACGQYVCSGGEITCETLDFASNKNQSSCEFFHAPLDAERYLDAGQTLGFTADLERGDLEGNFEEGFIGGPHGGLRFFNQEHRVVYSDAGEHGERRFTLDLWIKPKGNNPPEEPVFIESDVWRLGVVRDGESGARYKIAFSLLERSSRDVVTRWSTESAVLTYGDGASWHRVTVQVDADNRIDTNLNDIVKIYWDGLAVGMTGPTYDADVWGRLGLAFKWSRLCVGNACSNGGHEAEATLDDVKLYPFLFTPYPR